MSTATVNLIGRRVRIIERRCVNIGEWKIYDPYDATVLDYAVQGNTGNWTLLLLHDDGSIHQVSLGSYVQSITALPEENRVQRTPTAKEKEFPEFIIGSIQGH